MKKQLIILLTFIVKFSFAQDGSFDSSFAVNGVRQFSLGNKNTKGNFILCLSDSSIVTSGNSDTSYAGALFARSFYLAKFSSNGTIDSSFGTNGVIFIPDGSNGISHCVSMIKQPDDKILISAMMDGSPVFIRILPDGTYDNTFGNNGIATGTGYKMALQSDGKIVSSGQYFDGFNNMYRFSRYDSNGTLDSTFGINGVTIADVTPFRFDICYSVLIQPDDKIVAVGTSYDTVAMSPVIVRFDSDGNLDAAFGSNGVVITTLGASGKGIFKDIGILSDGKIVVGGDYYYTGGTGGFWGHKPAAVRFNIDGILDSTFGSNGMVILNTLFNANDDVRALKIQPDNKILLGGGAYSPFPFTDSYFYLVRLNAGGSIDLSFANNGYVLTNFSNSEQNIVYDIELQPDGKILATGTTGNMITEDIDAVVCRFNNQNPLAIEELSNEPEVLIYPNPSSGTFTISGIDNGIIEIYNVLGERLYFTDVNSESGMEINLQNISTGIYFVKVFDGDKSYCRKITISR